MGRLGRWGAVCLPDARVHRIVKCRSKSFQLFSLSSRICRPIVTRLRLSGPEGTHPMKLSLFSAAPVLLLASSTALAQTTGVAPAPAPAPAPAAAPAAAAPAPAADAPAAAAPEAPATAPAPAPVPAPAPAPLPPPAEVPPPVVLADTPLAAKLGISKDGFWQPSALLQFWIFGANQGGDTTTTLRIRRAELRVKGEIIPKFLSYNVMIDPARALDNST